MIEVLGLRKRFPAPGEPGGWRLAVDGLSFRAEPGRIFGLLGPNGAGKTTTLRLLVTLLAPDEGTAKVCGYDIREQPALVRAHIGYLSATTGLYGRLTVEEMLSTFARLQGVADPERRVAEMIARFDLRGVARQRCERLSTGQRQRANIARTLLHDPPVLVLDEPTAGLDVLAAQALLEAIEEARAQGRCVVFSTHILREAERLCDRIAIVHQGRIRAEGTLAELREATGKRDLEDVFLRAVAAP